MPSRRLLLAISMGALLPALTWGLAGEIAPARPAAQSSFASEIAALSEPAGYFDTDNLISNERSYLDVVPDLKKRGVRGGAYIGVGPDQNFTYIAAIRPDVAFIVDVRRDNLLLHLLFKSLFALARTRVEYLALLLGRPVPTDIESWRSAPLERVVSQAEAAPLDDRGVLALRRRVEEALGKIGVPLSDKDLSTIDQFHRRFIDGWFEPEVSVHSGARRSFTTPLTVSCCWRPTRSANAATTLRLKTRFNSSRACTSATRSSLSSGI